MDSYIQIVKSQLKLARKENWINRNDSYLTPAAYLSWLCHQVNKMHQSKIKSGTIKTYKTAIQWDITNRGLDWQVYKEIGKDQQRLIDSHTNLIPVNQDYPISSSDIHSLCINKNLDDLTTTACVTLATFLFHSLGRISELLHSPHHAPLDIKALNILATEGHYKQPQYKIHLHHPKVKTSQDQWLSPVSSSMTDVPKTDPHIMMGYYLMLRSKWKRDTSVLWLKSDGTPLTAIEFKAVIGNQLSRTIGECSFRSGGATNLARQGVPLDDIQILGRWQSTEAFRLYLRGHSTIIQAHITHERETRVFLEKIYAHFSTTATL